MALAGRSGDLQRKLEWVIVCGRGRDARVVLGDGSGILRADERDDVRVGGEGLWLCDDTDDADEPGRL